jgi:hypothetical protein
MQGPAEVPFGRGVDLQGPCAECEGVNPALGVWRRVGGWDGPKPGAPLGLVKPGPLASLAPLGDGVCGVVVEGEHGFLNCGNDVVHDSEGGQLCCAQGCGTGRQGQRVGEVSGGKVSRGVAGPVGRRVAHCDNGLLCLV